MAKTLDWKVVQRAQSSAQSEAVRRGSRGEGSSPLMTGLALALLPCELCVEEKAVQACTVASDSASIET